MWHQVELAISKHNQQAFRIEQKQMLSGGDISQAYCISQGEKQYFVKVNEAAFIENFNCEATSLASITHTQTIHVPKVIEAGNSKAHAYLILDYIPFNESPADDSWHQAGVELAKMHQVSSQPMFGYGDNNFIGHTPQYNRWNNNWASFFAEQRIGYQLELLAEKQIKIGDIDDIVALIHNLLKPRKVQASLLHGDLWRGNIGFDTQQAYIFDPACYYGDYEADLAMTELFGSYPQAFYTGYHSITPQESGYLKRQLIYNFYHILNHANLFSGHYIAQAKQILTQLNCQT